MKIGITCYPTYGGSGVVATELGLELAKQGHDVHFISYAIPFRLSAFSERVHYHEVEMTTYALFDYVPYSLSLAAKMAEVAEFEDLDVLHVHYAIPHAPSAYLAKQMIRKNQRLKELRIVTTLHGTDITLLGRDRLYLNLIKFSIEESDGATAVSKYLRNRTYSEFKVNGKIEVIPNFIDTERYNKIEGHESRCESFLHKVAHQGEKIITHTSNFRPVKRIADVISVFAKVRESVPSKLILIGDGPDRSNAERLCRELGVCEDTVFLGKQENVIDFLALSDVFLLPSESESFGLAALEAMSCKTPVVATNTGGIPEVVIHEENGFLADVGDINAMADGVTRILKDEKLGSQMAESARQRAMTYFDIRKIIPQYESFYEQVLG